jgi:hypothetical protein
MAAGRLYTLTWDAPTAVTTIIDIFEIDPAAGKPVVIHELCIWQTTELGDAMEEIIPVSLRRGYTTSGSGGAAAVIGEGLAGDSAASFTAECRNTTVATTGTPDIIHQDGWNVRVPYIWTPTPLLQPMSTDPILVVRLDAAPGDTTTIAASLKVEELG